MSNGRSSLTVSSGSGRGPNVTITLGLPLFIDPINRIFGGRGDRRNRASGGRAGAGLITRFKAPTPQTPFPPIEQFPAPRAPTTTFPRPTTVFGSGELGTRGAIFRAAIGRVIGVVGAAIFVRDLLRQFEDLESLERERERQADVEGVLRRGRIDLEPRIIDLPPAVAEPLPEAQPTPTRPLGDPTLPQRIPLPDRPLEIPTPSLPELAPPIPEIDPQAPVTLPQPKPLPRVPLAVPSPLRLPDFVVLPQLPFSSPTRPAPVADPKILTPFQTPRLPFPTPTPTPFANPQAFPQPSAPPRTPRRTATDECEVVQRRRRRRGRCREGFFREFRDGTQFITWRSRSCSTGANFPSIGI